MDGRSGCALSWHCSCAGVGARGYGFWWVTTVGRHAFDLALDVAGGRAWSALLLFFSFFRGWHAHARDLSKAGRVGLAGGVRAPRWRERGSRDGFTPSPAKPARPA